MAKTKFMGVLGAVAMMSSVAACSGSPADTVGETEGATEEAQTAAGTLHRYEVEDGFAPSYGRIATISDAHASKGKAVELLTNSLVFVNYQNTVTRTKHFHVAARGTDCQGWPKMNLWIVYPDGHREGKQASPIDNTSYQEVDFGTFTIQKGLSQIAIEFPDDKFVAGQCDRNLILDYVEVRDL